MVESGSEEAGEWTSEGGLNGGGPQSVSYTHLDVYKRQTLACVIAAMQYMLNKSKAKQEAAGKEEVAK